MKVIKNDTFFLTKIAFFKSSPRHAESFGMPCGAETVRGERISGNRQTHTRDKDNYTLAAHARRGLIMHALRAVGKRIQCRSAAS